MSRLSIVVEVDGPDPRLVDPEEVAESILAEYEEWQRFNQDAPVVVFESAEWS